MTVSGINEKINRGAVKSVQRGTISGSGSCSVTISPVNMRKSIVSFLGVTPGSAVTDMGYVALQGPGTVTFIKGGSAASTVSFEVIEFF